MEGSKKSGLGPIHFLKAIEIAVGIIGAFLCVSALLLWKTEINELWISVLLIAADVVAAFFGGFYLGKKAGHKKYLWGILFGVILFVIYFGIVIMSAREGVNAGAMIRTLCVMSLSGMLGGMFG